MSTTSEQVFEWGTTQWVYEPSPWGHGRITVGIVVLWPGCVQGSHIHYAEEQMVFGLDGVGVHIVDGVNTEVSPGSFLHIPAGSMHEMHNLGRQEHRFIALLLPPQPRVATGTDAGVKAPGDLSQVWEEVRNSAVPTTQAAFTSITGFSLAVISDDRKFVLSPSGLPAFCEYFRRDRVGRDACNRRIVKRHSLAAALDVSNVFECCSGLVCAAVPINVDGVYFGSVICGHAPLKHFEADQFQEAEERASSVGLDGEIARDLLKRSQTLAKGKLYVIAQAFAEVVSTEIGGIQGLIAERNLADQRAKLIIEMERRTKLESSLREVDMRLLQSHTNPHFMFNTLHCIAGLAMLESADKTARVTLALSRLLRYNLGKFNIRGTVKELRQYLEDYLYIYKIRYEDKLDYDIYASDEAQHAMVPFMVVQPLVENAVVHGFEPKVGHGRLDVKISKESDRLQIRVTDDGVGMDRERLEALKAMRYSEDFVFPTDGCLGLLTLHRRLRYFYGTDYNLTVTSELGCGTSVCLDIPFTEP